MYKTWGTSAEDLETLERALDLFLNEYVGTLISVSYAISERHHVLVVYEPVEVESTAREEAAVSAAEEILEQAEEQLG
jgi:hypothetical protein